MCLQSRLWNYLLSLHQRPPSLSTLRVRFVHRPQMWADKPRELLPLGSEGLLQAQPSDGQAQAEPFDSSCIPSTHTERFWKEEREGGR